MTDDAERSIPPTSKERTRRGHIMVLREILHHGTVETGAWEAAIRYAIHKLELQSPDETTARPFVVYRSCAKHIGIPWTLSVTYTAPPKEVCPICEPPEKAGGEP